MNVKEKIKQNNIKQWALAEYLGISEFTLCRYLRRPEKLSGDIIIKIDKALNTLIEEGIKNE